MVLALPYKVRCMVQHCRTPSLSSGRGSSLRFPGGGSSLRNHQMEGYIINTLRNPNADEGPPSTPYETPQERGWIIKTRWGPRLYDPTTVRVWLCDPTKVRAVLRNPVRVEESCETSCGWRNRSYDTTKCREEDHVSCDTVSNWNGETPATPTLDDSFLQGSGGLPCDVDPGRYVPPGWRRAVTLKVEGIA